jgi:two-component system NarL family sensor kinase
MHLRYKFILLGLGLLWVCSAMGQTDSLIGAYEKSTSPETRGDIAFQIAKRLYYGDPAQFIVYARKGYADVRNLEVPAKVNLANLLGIYFSMHGAYDSGGHYYAIAMAAARRLKDAALINKVTSNLGELYSFKGEYEQALKEQLQVLSYAEQHHNEADAQRVKINIGNTYSYMHEYRRALKYYEQVYPDLKDEKTRMAGNLFNSMGSAYDDVGDKQKGDRFLRQSLEIKKSLDDTTGIANTTINLAVMANDRGDKAGAIVLYNEALVLAKKTGDERIIRVIQQNLGNIEQASGHATKAIMKYKASLVAARANGDLRLERDALAKLFAIYDTLHDYSNAYRYMGEYEKLADTTRGDRDRLSYESQQQAIARIRAVRERNGVIGFSAGMIALLSIVFALAWRIRAIRAKAEEEKGFTRAIFEGEQNERIRIARDLHDSIGQMLSVVVMRLGTLPGLDQAELKESAAISAQLVHKTLEEVRTISHNLIPEDLHFGIVRGLENLCQKISSAGEVGVRLAISDEVRARKFGVPFSLSLYRIVQEVLGNMMRHSGASEINVSMSEAATLVILQIEDNGKGFDTKSIGGSKGIGWKNIFARVNLLNGSVDVQSARISGTRIEITIPQ